MASGVLKIGYNPSARTLAAEYGQYFLTGQNADLAHAAAAEELLYETDFTEFSIGATVTGGGNSEWTWDEANEAEGNTVRVVDLGGGQRGLRFRFLSGAAWAEQRFTLPNRHLEIVFKQTIRIPSNFNYAPGTGSDEGNNNKAHMYIWGAHENSGTWSGEDDYGGCGRMCGIGFNMWSPEVTASECEITPYMFGTVGGFDTHNPSTVKVGGDTWDRAEFIAPADIGQTVTFYTRLKAASSADNDGIIQVWKKRGTTVTQVMNITTGHMYMSGQTGWNKGYVFGYANARYNVTTDLTIEYFAMHDSMPAAWAAELGI